VYVSKHPVPLITKSYVVLKSKNFKKIVFQSYINLIWTSLLHQKMSKTYNSSALQNI